MKRTVTAVLAVALLLPHADGAAAPQQRRDLKPDRIDISYLEPNSADHQSLYRMLKEHRALEKIQDLLRPLRLPHRVLLQTRGCDGISNAWSNEDRIVVCYEYLDDLWKNVPRSTTPAGVAPIDALIGPFVDVFLHEAGHVIFAALNIPLFGREEDAADQLSTYLMLRFNKELREAGELVDAQGLAGPEEARLVRADRSGAPEVTDGPYPEAKEFLAGFWIVDCESTDRAYAIAARASAAPGKGGVPLNMPIEVREVMSAPPVDM